jgi:hypothetical protein
LLFLACVFAWLGAAIFAMGLRHESLFAINCFGEVQKP